MSNNNSGLSDSKRLKKILDLKFISANKLSRLLGYKSPASVYHVIEGRNNLSSDMISRLIKKFPDVNFRFLKEGKEEPLLTDQKQIQAQKNMFGSDDSMSRQESILKMTPHQEEPKMELSLSMINYQLKELIEVNKMQNDLLEKILVELRKRE